MKKNTLFILSIILLFWGNLNAQSVLILDEDFDNNTNNWEITDNVSEKTEINSSKYFMQNLDKNSWHWFSVDVDYNNKMDYYIESNIDKLNSYSQNDNYGIIWGANDNKNLYVFLINPFKQSFCVYAVFNGRYLKMIDWQKNTNIEEKLPNKLTIVKLDGEINFLVNDEIVGMHNSIKFFGYKTGFYVSPKIRISAEYLTVKDITNENFNDEESVNNKPEWNGNGSGFFINANGYITTNYHVIKDATEIQIELIKNGEKKTHKAKVISIDKLNDLAIIKIDDSTFKPFAKLPYSFKTDISDIGSNVFTLGYPMALSIMGDEVKFTDGKISSKTGYQGDITTYQVSVPVQPGNSGGPLFDYSGNIIGVVSAKIMEADNVSYAIKSNYLKNLIEVLPESINLPNDQTLSTKSLTEKIKILSEYVVLIKTKKQL